MQKMANKWKTLPDQPEHPSIQKTRINLGPEKPYPINSADMSRLPPPCASQSPGGSRTPSAWGRALSELSVAPLALFWDLLRPFK